MEENTTGFVYVLCTFEQYLTLAAFHNNPFD